MKKAFINVEVHPALKKKVAREAKKNQMSIANWVRLKLTEALNGN